MFRQQLSWHSECVGIVDEFGTSGLFFVQSTCLQEPP
jgi:hypothetical protein